MKYQEIEGDLIQLALEGRFEVIGHGVNCFCIMKAGIAPQMVKAFSCNKYYKEREYPGNINKLGSIDFATSYVKSGVEPIVYTTEVDKNYPLREGYKKLYVVNAYTQYNYGRNHADGDSKPLDYEALTLCMRKINHIFKGKHIGLPGFIGGGLAGGDINKIRKIIRDELIDCDVSIVFLPQNKHQMLEEFR